MLHKIDRTTSEKALIKVISKLRVDAGFEWLLEDILNFMPVWIY